MFLTCDELLHKIASKIIINYVANCAQQSVCSFQRRIDHQTHLNSHIQRHKLSPNTQQNRLSSVRYRHSSFSQSEQSTHLWYLKSHSDFIYQRDLYDFESYLKICKVGILKNMLIVISSERILIHDLKSKTNKSYIPI